jgi:hypothetical protein
MQPYSSPPWQPSAPPAQPPSRRGLIGVLIAGSVLVVLLVGAIVVVAIVRSGKHEPTSTAADGSSAPASAAIDTCLVGTWKVASEHMQLDLPQIGAVTLIGQGLLSHVHADGSVDDDYGQATPYTGSASGHAIAMSVTGTAHSRIATAGGTMSFHDVTANGTVSYQVDGTAAGSPVPLSLSTDPVQYTCLNGNASEHTDRYDATLTKVSDSP